ncbi:MAG: hypothetical protein QMC17_05955 [Paracoccaceae bacterium]|jgi:hypothetical protein
MVIIHTSFTLLVGLFFTTALAESEPYVPYSGIIHGTSGTEPVSITITNRSRSPIACQAALAHWYSKDVGRLIAGESLKLKLWHDPETGVINLMNATDTRMPVEALWCVIETDQTALRARLDLPMQSGTTKSQFRFGCEVNATRQLSCTTERN